MHVHRQVRRDIRRCHAAHCASARVSGNSENPVDLWAWYLKSEYYKEYLNNIEEMPHSILFWRSMTQWIGGMGIIVLTIAILPLLGIGGMELFNRTIQNEH